MAKVSLEKDKIKFLLVEGVHQKALESLRAAGYTNIEFHKGALDDEQLKESIRDAHFIGLRSRTHLTEDVINAAEKLVAIGCFCIGTNQVDLDAAAKRGIPVFNAPFSNTRSVAELVIGELLLLLRGVPEANAKAHRGVWNKLAAGSFEARGKKLGIIGLGAIGAMVANAASALGMEVYGYDPYISIDAAWNLSRTIKHIKSLDEIYSQCDYITIHVPLLDSTRQMINKEALDKMKDGVVLLNFARDLLVDEDALIEALDSGKVKKYVTDFANHTVAGHKGILVTPHLGASTEESEENCAVMAVKEVRDFLENGNIKNSVNFPNCDMGTCVAVGRIAICHKNIPNMISQFTKILGAEGLNIADMTNKSKGEYAYTLIDLESTASKEALDELKAIEGVSRVRVVK